MASYLFKVIIEEDEMDDGRAAYSAHCPALSGCNTWGFSYDEALKNVQEAIALYLESLQAHGEPIPVDPERGVVQVESPSVLVNV